VFYLDLVTIEVSTESNPAPSEMLARLAQSMANKPIEPPPSVAIAVCATVLTARSPAVSSQNSFVKIVMSFLSVAFYIFVGRCCCVSGHDNCQQGNAAGH
jgi:hypothetical protein